MKKTTCAASLAGRFVGIALFLLLAGCESPAVPEFFTGPTMGTTYHVELAPLPQSVTRGEVQRVIDSVLVEINAHLSTYDPHSEISRFNASPSSEWTPVSAPFLAVVEAARRVSEQSQGAFDLTVSPLVELWGFGESAGEAARDPDPATIAAAEANVGYQKLELRSAPPALRKRVPGLHLDVAGIAPGYAVDLIVERLQRLGVTAGIVELGGEVRAWGRSPEARPWRVAVEVPVAGERRPYTLVDLPDLAVSTSGDYRDFRIEHGRRLSHTIDPHTGQPIAHDLASVTVLHPSTMYADAYATALTVLGPEQGFALAERLGLAALFIERVPPDGHWRERATAAFQRLRRPVGGSL